MVAAAAAGVLLDAAPFTVVQEQCLAGGAGRRILAGGEPSFGVVGEQRAGGTTPRARRLRMTVSSAFSLEALPALTNAQSPKLFERFGPLKWMSSDPLPVCNRCLQLWKIER